MKHKHIKNFELFTEKLNISSIDNLIIDVNRMLSNNDFINKINNTLDKIPNKMIKKSTNYIIDNGIDIDKINYYIEKYNLIDKVKKYIDKGYNYSDIMNKLTPVTESVMIIGILSVILFGLTSALAGYQFFRGENELLSKFIIPGIITSLLLSIIYVSVQYGLDNSRTSELNDKNNKIYFNVENTESIVVIYLNNKKDSIEIYQNPDDRTYYIKKNDNPYKAYYHMKYE